MNSGWKKWGAAALLLLLAGASRAAQGLPAAVEQALLQANVPSGSVTMMVTPLAPPPGTVVAATESGGHPAHPAPPSSVLAPPPRLAWQVDKPMNPASVMKLVTTYAALDLLGPEYFWKTRVYTQGYVKDGTLHGQLLIQGSGDPKLVHERLASLIEAIRDQGVTDIDGDILLDHSVLHLPPHDPAAFDDDPLRPYNVGPDGLLINFKALVLKFVPERGAKQVRIESEPPMAGVSIPTSVPAAAGACGDWRTRLAADFHNPNRVTLNGRFPTSCGERHWAVAYVDPASHAPRVIEAMWKQAGGTLSGQVKWLDTPATGQPLVTGYSLPLAEIVHDVNKFSNNVMAQQLYLSLSSSGDGRGSFGESANALARWWRGAFGMRQMPQVDNGSGLSRNGRVHASSLTALLQHAAQSPHAKVFERSLPLAGINGTARHLARRSPDSQAIGNARLKTGSLRDVMAIAGYAQGRSGQRYAVVGIVNHINAKAAQPALDRLVEWAIDDD